MNFRHRFLALFAFLIVAATAPALGADLTFTTTLRGDRLPTISGSTATGDAKIIVHTDNQTLDATVKVKGITLANLYQHLVHATVGPMHLHVYAADGSASLLLPFPMGPSYTAMPDGFAMTLTGYRYADGAKILESKTSFDEFVEAMKLGSVVLNIHTERYEDGEISGKIQILP